MRKLNLVGLPPFGRLIVIAFSHMRNSKSYWLCRCECGTLKIIQGGHLISGNTTSCGCYKSEMLSEMLSKVSSERNTTHGQSYSRTYNCWSHMLQRCTNLNDPYYEDYGGRGITVCNRWYLFENFLEDMGEKPDNLSLDRIDNEGDYEPGNCKWSTATEQANNRRNSVK